MKPRYVAELHEDLLQFWSFLPEVLKNQGSVIRVSSDHGIGAIFFDTVEQYLCHCSIKERGEGAPLSDACFQHEARSFVVAMPDIAVGLRVKRS